MSYYNGKKVLSVVRAGFKGGSLTLSAHGRYIPQDYGLEGFTDVINEAPETPTDVLKYIEGDDTITYLAFGTDITKIAGCFQCFPNLEKIYIQNTSEVLDIASNAWDGTKVVTDGEIVVPNNLKSAYETAYPNWNISSWEYQSIFTIPFIGETTLTAEYIQSVVNVAGGSISSVNKVVVPIEFTEYESGAIAKIQELFTSLRYLETTYDDGAMELDLTGEQADVLAKITSIGKTLDEALVYAKNTFYSIVNTSDGTRNNQDLIIMPPYSGYIGGTTGSISNKINSCSNLVYIDKLEIKNTTYYGYVISSLSNLIEVKEVKIGANNVEFYQFLGTGLGSLKRAKVICTGTEILTTNYRFLYMTGSLEEPLLYNFKANSLNISWSTNYTRQSLVNLFNSLGTPTTTQTLAIGSTNLAKLTQADIDIALNKNWTLS